MTIGIGMVATLRKIGIGVVGNAPWGTHFCHFFETKEDLLDTLLPYFRTGLEERELCVWVVAEPLTPGEAEGALRRAVPDLDRHLADRSIEIHAAAEWYPTGGDFDPGKMTGAWDAKLADALERGFAGLRVNGSAAWLEKKDWRSFSEYEDWVDESIVGKRMIVLCTYPLSHGAAEILDVARTHQFAIVKRDGSCEVIENPAVRLRARNRQQSALAALSKAAIRAQDLTTILDEAAVRAAETLGTERSSVLEHHPDEGELVVRSVFGWSERRVRGSTVAAGDGSVASAMLRSDTPFVVPDMRIETRFETASLLAEGVLSAMGVVIRGRARPWGLLNVQTTSLRAFGPDDIDFLQSVANILALAVERHEVEVEERRGRETLEAIFDNIPVMISFFDESGRLARVNREWERVLGWTLEEARHVDILAETYPDPARRREVLEFIQRAERRWADFQVRARDGRLIDASWARFRLSNGLRMGFGIDITERKRAEEALRESEGRFRQLAESIDEVFWLATPDLSEVLYVSPTYERVYGRSCESLYREPESWLEAVHPEDRSRVRSVALGKSATELDQTYRVVRPDRSVRWIRDRAFPIRDASGAVYRFAGVAEDVTDRRRGEEERVRLLESETRAKAEAEAALERLRAIQTITDAALSYLGLDDLLRELLARLRSALRVELASVRLIDDERKELYARAIDGVPLERVADITIPLDAVDLKRPFLSNEIEPPAPGGDDWQARWWAAVNMDFRAGMSTPLVVEGKPIGLVGVVSTRAGFTETDLELLRVVADRVAPAIERGRLMETVRAGRERSRVLSHRLLSAQEEERRRIAVELHDELGQVLTAVKINLASLERSGGAVPASDQLGDAIDSVDQAIERVRDLALDLHPSVLDDLGLPAALRWYADRLARAARIEALLSIETIPRLPPEVETACFRAAQEALTNVVRHAQASHVWLELHLVAGDLELVVHDDGLGFDAGGARERAMGGASIGVLGMRERVALAGGELEIRSSQGRGTEVRARFPVREMVRTTA